MCLQYYFKWMMLFHYVLTYKKQEEDHLAKALKNCNYPMWAFNRIKIMMNNPAHRKTKTSSTQQINIPKTLHNCTILQGAE